MHGIFGMPQIGLNLFRQAQQSSKNNQSSTLQNLSSIYHNGGKQSMKSMFSRLSPTTSFQRLFNDMHGGGYKASKLTDPKNMSIEQLQAGVNIAKSNSNIQEQNKLQQELCIRQNNMSLPNPTKPTASKQSSFSSFSTSITSLFSKDNKTQASLFSNPSAIASFTCLSNDLLLC